MATEKTLQESLRVDAGSAVGCALCWAAADRLDVLEAQNRLLEEVLKAALATHGDHYSWGPQALAVLNGDNHD